MRKVPCTICPNCGLYNDISVGTCECGRDLTTLPAALVDAEISPDKCGEVSKFLTFYVQKCSVCGTLSFTTDETKRVRVCRKCGKARIADIDPVLYVNEEDQPKQAPQEVSKEQEAAEAAGSTEVSISQSEAEQVENDAEAAFWGGLLHGIQEAVGTVPSDDVSSDAPSAPLSESEGDDESDVDNGGWGSLVGTNKESGTSQGKKNRVSQEEGGPAPREEELTMSALRYGRHSFTIKASQAVRSVTLGRSALQGDFLSKDGRVSNEHCFITYRDGQWYVTDNHATNGTFLNEKYLGRNGESRLQDGDSLRLGHNPDSMEFRISIR